MSKRINKFKFFRQFLNLEKLHFFSSIFSNINWKKNIFHKKVLNLKIDGILFSLIWQN